MSSKHSTRIVPDPGDVIDKMLRVVGRAQIRRMHGCVGVRHIVFQRAAGQEVPNDSSRDLTEVLGRTQRLLSVPVRETEPRLVSKPHSVICGPLLQQFETRFITDS